MASREINGLSPATGTSWHFTYVIYDTFTGEYVGGASAPLTPWVHLAKRFKSADDAKSFIRILGPTGLLVEPVSRAQIEASVYSQEGEHV